MQVIDHKDGIRNGSTSTLRICMGFLDFKWVAMHFGYLQVTQFQDRMIEGLFQSWIHTHSFSPDDEGHCIVEDKIAYSPPFGKIGSVLMNKIIQYNLNQLFHYRHRILNNDINLWKTIKE